MYLEHLRAGIVLGTRNTSMDTAQFLSSKILNPNWREKRS